MSAVQFITAAMEDAANRILRLDSETLQRLGELDGKVVCLQYRQASEPQSPLTWYVLPSEGGLRLVRDYDGQADVTITGNLPAFARLMAGDSASAMFASAEMQIRGDMELGQRFQRIMREMEIDWEEHASRYVGDILAHKLGNLLRGMHTWQAQARENLSRDLVEYLQEESLLLPWREGVEAFMRGVDTLRGDIDRLEKRVQRLRDQI